MDIAVKLGFFNTLFFILLFCKLAGYITLSWWWVTAPLWVTPVSLVILFIVFTFLVKDSSN